jgi:hypothetical protein
MSKNQHNLSRRDFQEIIRFTAAAFARRRSLVTNDDVEATTNNVIRIHAFNLRITDIKLRTIRSSVEISRSGFPGMAKAQDPNDFATVQVQG